MKIAFPALIGFALASASIMACANGMQERAPKKADKTITAFSFADKLAVGIIDETAREITVTLPPATSLAALAPSVSHSGIAISPPPGEARDFSGPVEYTVRAEDGSSQSYKIFASTSVYALKVASARPDSLELAWRPASWADAYLLESSAGANGPWSTVSDSIQGASYVHAGLAPWTSGYYRIAALRRGVSGASSAIIVGTTTSTPPLAPIVLWPDEGSENPTRLAWSCSDPDGDPLSYSLILSRRNPPAASDPGSILRQDLAATTFEVPESLDGTWYWRISAGDGRGNRTEGPVRGFIRNSGSPYSAPSAPRLRPHEALNPRAISWAPPLDWGKGASRCEYRVELESPSLNYRRTYSPTTSTSFLLPADVMNADDYRVTIWADNGTGNAGAGATASFSIRDPYLPSLPEISSPPNNTVINAGIGGNVVIRWSLDSLGWDSTPPVFYLLMSSTSDFSQSTPDFAGNSSTFSTTRVFTTGTTYFKLRADIGGGKFRDSETRKITVQP